MSTSATLSNANDETTMHRILECDQRFRTNNVVSNPRRVGHGSNGIIYFSQYVRAYLQRTDLVPKHIKASSLNPFLNVKFWERLKTNKDKHVILISLLVAALEAERINDYSGESLRSPTKTENERIDLELLSKAMNYKRVVKILQRKTYHLIKVTKINNSECKVLIRPDLIFRLKDTTGKNYGDDKNHCKHSVGITFSSMELQQHNPYNLMFLQKNEKKKYHDQLYHNQISRLSMILQYTANQGLIEENLIDKWRHLYTGHLLGYFPFNKAGAFIAFVLAVLFALFNLVLFYASRKVLMLLTLPGLIMVILSGFLFCILAYRKGTAPAASRDIKEWDFLVFIYAYSTGAAGMTYLCLVMIHFMLPPFVRMFEFCCLLPGALLYLNSKWDYKVYE